MKRRAVLKTLATASMFPFMAACWRIPEIGEAAKSHHATQEI